MRPVAGSWQLGVQILEHALLLLATRPPPPPHQKFFWDDADQREQIKTIVKKWRASEDVSEEAQERQAVAK